jgi:hypothetical protein
LNTVNNGLLYPHTMTASDVQPPSWPLEIYWEFDASDIVNEQALEECAPLKTSDQPQWGIVDWKYDASTILEEQA